VLAPSAGSGQYQAIDLVRPFGFQSKLKVALQDRIRIRQTGDRVEVNMADGGRWRRRLFAVPVIGLLGAVVPSPGLAQQSFSNEPAAQAADTTSSIGNPESIRGDISMVRPGEGLLVVTKRGPGQAPALVITGATMVTRNPDGSASRTDVGVTASTGPGETNYSFRVTGSTRIRINGRSAALRDLTALRDKKATVRFRPERNGNFASSIDVTL
jgi:hypothetical protein